MFRQTILCWSLGLATAWAQGGNPPPAGTTWKTANARVNALVDALSVDEKLSLVHGSSFIGTQNLADDVDAVSRMGIPPLNMADGEAGVNAVADATMLPSQLNIGATFQPDLAYLHGRVAGLEARLLNVSVLLAPRVNILRDPFNGSFWQSYSEDTFLTSVLGKQAVKGIQSQGTLATAKQIGASSTGSSQGDSNSQVDPQVLHEIYLAPHEALVQAGVGVIMCSATKVNGVSVCESNEILDQTIRVDWNFTGIVMSDRGGTKSTVASMMAGLDWEHGSTVYYGDALQQAIYGGSAALSDSFLNRAVSRVLSTYVGAGLLDDKGSQGTFVGPLSMLETTGLSTKVVGDHRNDAYELAVQSGVLLKNDKDALPLAVGARVGVIGPAGQQLTNGAGYGERAFGFPQYKMSPLDAIQGAHTSSKIPTALGVDIHGEVVPTWALRTPDGRAGIRRDDSNGNNVVDPYLNFTGSTALPAYIGYDWTGQIYAPETGIYRIALQRYYPSTGSSVANDPTYVRLNTSSLATIQWIVDSSGPFKSMRLFGDGGLRPWGSAIPTPDGWDEVAADLQLTEGWHDISIGVPALFAGDKTQVRLSWTPPAARRTQLMKAVDLASQVDVPLVFAHAESPAASGMQLLQGFDELIAAVAKVNKKTVVVLYNAEPVLMPWLNDVAAVLWMGHPGQEGGHAVHDLLYGVRAPRGRLPVTYPAQVDTSLTGDPSYPERVNTPSGTAVFSEGINAGYRGYLANQTSVLFPFGFGLSYTRFNYTRLNVTVQRNRGAVTSLDVALRVHNVGGKDGHAVPQVYIGPPHTAVHDYPGIQFAVAQLVEFRNLEIRAGKTHKVQFHIPPRQLSFWDPSTRKWTLAKGTRDIWIGIDAENRVLVGNFTI